MIASDGFPECARCNSGRFIVVERVSADGRVVTSEVIACPDCNVAALRRAEAAQKLSTRAERLDGKTFETFDVRGVEGRMPVASLALALEASREFAAQPKGWLVLYGPVGTGKTHLLGAIYNALKTTHPAVYVSAGALLARIKETFSARDDEASESDVMRAYLDAPVLLVDDLAKEQLTEWARATWFALFNYRYINDLPTVISTNEDIRSGNDLGDALTDRMLDSAISRALLVKAPSYRRR